MLSVGAVEGDGDGRWLVLVWRCDVLKMELDHQDSSMVRGGRFDFCMRQIWD